MTLTLIALVATGPLLAGAAPAGAVVSTPEPAAASSIPGTHVGERLDWLLAELNAGLPTLTEANVVDYFADDLLVVLPPGELLATLGQFAASAPLTFLGVARPPTDQSAIAVIGIGPGLTFLTAVVVEAAEPYRIANLVVQPAPPEVRPLPAGESPPYSGLYDIGGRSLYLWCSGSGSPTVILEAGYTTPPTSMLGIQAAISPLTTVCSYDRANIPGGASDPVATPRTGIDVVHDLHALLETAGVPGPYVLVGHSIGGIYIRLYAAEYPDEVVGMVLEDSSHEDQDIRSRALVDDQLWDALEAQSAGIPDPEGLDFAATFDQMRAARAAGPLRPMPLVVLTSGISPDPSLFPSGWPVAAEEALRLELQDDLATLVPNARHVIAEESGHFIHDDQPDLVIGAIQLVVAAVRDPATWPMPAASPVAT
ncbi:MAG: alpha/beta fold hydrolase [Thermomicrobiales bacterium]|nr:alpha/beta fold hydrolase [Thermomicrobiales bacterium]